MSKYDLIVIGSGPGGYVAAIRASQLGAKVAIVERAELGGVCLNWGCIPTKALLRSAHALEEAKRLAEFGIECEGDITANFEKVIERSRGVSATMSKGVQFLLNKNGVEVIVGSGALVGGGCVEVKSADGGLSTIEATNIILATGARARQLPNIPIDGKKIISYKEALTMAHKPSSMVVIGSGAIGVELASVYHAMGCSVTIVEYMPTLVPTEDEEVSKYLERSMRKARIPFITSATVESVDTSGQMCDVKITTPKGEQHIMSEVVLSAVGVQPNIENLGLEKLGIECERGRIKVDEYYQTNVAGVYAIGDIIPTPALAHVASAEAICCVEKILGQNPSTLNYKVVPACIYTTPEIASVGMRERDALAAGYELRIGRFPYTASGKATAMGNKDGFVKLIFDAKTDLLLGAHLIGTNVTEMVMELALAMQEGIAAHAIIKTIHPHPTLAEGVMESAAAAYSEAIHI